MKIGRCCRLELTHSNSQASVPFLLSDRGYGMLWHNPAIGQASFNVNVTEWAAMSTTQLDYWIVAGDTPAQIEEAYADATGKVPMIPEYAMGFWQCKLRYRSQDELMNVAREHKRRGLPISVIVIDFFHWSNQGDWKFDERYWPDPEGMVQELRDMGIELMVSVWPTVQTESENYGEMVEKGYLVRSDRGVRTQFQFLGQNEIFDATHPEAREFLWQKIKQNYYDKGIRLFWLDEAEPEFAVYDPDIYRYDAGPALQVGNWYPSQYSRTFYEGMTAEGQEDVINLVRCAWAGSQRYGALAWSDDIASNFEVLGHQVRAGLNMAIAHLTAKRIRVYRAVGCGAAERTTKSGATGKKRTAFSRNICGCGNGCVRILRSRCRPHMKKALRRCCMRTLEAAACICRAAQNGQTRTAEKRWRHDR